MEGFLDPSILVFSNIFGIISMNELTFADIYPEGVPIITEDDQYSRTITTRNGNKLEITTYFKKPEAFIDELKAKANDFSRSSKIGNTCHLATIPTALYMDMARQGMTDDKKYMARFLNDSDNAWMRVNNLRV